MGAWKYATDATTDVWCCAYAIDDGPIQLWLPGDPVPPEFIETANNPLPYRLPELLAAPPSEPTWICEGEKDAANVAALGLISTTNPGGACNPNGTGKWQPELSPWFKGKELVYSRISQ